MSQKSQFNQQKNTQQKFNWIKACSHLCKNLWHLSQPRMQDQRKLSLCMARLRDPILSHLRLAVSNQKRPLSVESHNKRKSFCPRLTISWPVLWTNLPSNRTNQRQSNKAAQLKQIYRRKRHPQLLLRGTQRSESHPLLKNRPNHRWKSRRLMS